MEKGQGVFAVVATGGKQYKVQVGDEVFVEKLGLNEGEVVEFDILALFRGGKAVFGNPTVPEAKVRAKVVKNGRCKKIAVFTYKPKKNCKRKIGHRQMYTKVCIDSVVSGI